MKTLTVTIITLNEEKDLPRCLGSIKEIADEIVVVDCGSTDGTVEVARRFGAKVYFRKFDNYTNQKNFAASKVNGDWILSIDADEEISPELALEIKSKIQISNSKFVAFTIPRKNIIFGK
ncbi:MAG: Glycosyl transferase, group 2 family, partial [Candidatus Woesebacteria bacterium GW2011_GWB1_38_5b]